MFFSMDSMGSYVSAIECVIMHPRDTKKQNQCRKDHASGKIEVPDIKPSASDKSTTDTNISCNPPLPEILFTNTPIHFKDQKENYITITSPSGEISTVASPPDSNTFFCFVSSKNLESIRDTKKYDHDSATYGKEPIMFSNKDLLLIMVRKYDAAKQFGTQDGDPSLDVVTITKNTDTNAYAFKLLNIANPDVDISKIEPHKVVFSQTKAAESDKTFSKIALETWSNFLFYNYNIVNLKVVDGKMENKDFLMNWIAKPIDTKTHYSPSEASIDYCAYARASIPKMMACKSTTDDSITGIEFYDSGKRKYTCKEGSKQTVLPAYYHEKTEEEKKFEKEMDKAFTESAERNRRNGILQSLIGSFISSLIFSALISALISSAHRPSFVVLWIILFVIFFPLGYVASWFI